MLSNHRTSGIRGGVIATTLVKPKDQPTRTEAEARVTGRSPPKPFGTEAGSLSPFRAGRAKNNLLPDVRGGQR